MKYLLGIFRVVYQKVSMEASNLEEAMDIAKETCPPIFFFPHDNAYWTDDVVIDEQGVLINNNVGLLIETELKAHCVIPDNWVVNAELIEESKLLYCVTILDSLSKLVLRKVINIGDLHQLVNSINILGEELHQRTSTSEE